MQGHSVNKYTKEKPFTYSKPPTGIFRNSSRNSSVNDVRLALFDRTVSTGLMSRLDPDKTPSIVDAIELRFMWPVIR